MAYASPPVFGRPMFVAREFKPATVPGMGPRIAMAETLAEYLKCAVFRVKGDGGPDRDFALTTTFPVWPDPAEGLPYPCASIVESTDTFHEEQFQPQAVEATLGVYDCVIGYEADPLWPKTCLWRTADATCDFQVDFWTSAESDRQAIEAQLGFLFNPGQERTGVLLGGHPRYYAQPVRATLLSHRRIDDENAVYPNERRLQTMIRCNVAVVDLRIAVLLTPRTSVEATDPND